MPRTLLALIAFAPLAALAAPYETIVASCEDLPKIEERNIANSRGDQSVLKANESFTYEYAYRVKEKVHLVLEAGEGKLETQDFDRMLNRTRQFHGDSVASVRNQAEGYTRSRELFACKH